MRYEYHLNFRADREDKNITTHIQGKIEAASKPMAALRALNHARTQAPNKAWFDRAPTIYLTLSLIEGGST